MNKRIHLLAKVAFGLCIGLFIFISCQQNEGILPDDPSFEVQRDGSPMILGKQLENPYSVENMKKALENLTAQGRMDEDITIETTDLYVRFLPVDSLEQQALESDSSLNLYDYPLDFEVDQEGHWYHDPSIPDHLPTYQYTVVKPDFVLPDTIEYEILAELFIPEEMEEDDESGRISVDLDFLRALEDEALRLTDNWEEPLDLSSVRYNPSGTIRVRERVGGSSQGYLPVKGVRVRVRRWFTIKTDYTNSNGYYKISKRFRRAVNYSIVFRTPRFRVTGWTGHSSRYNGPKKENSWSKDFGWHSEWWVRSTLINAITDFKTQATSHGLALPSTLHPERVRPLFRDGVSNVIFHYVPGGSDVQIFTKDGTTNLETDDLHQLMMHELGHVSHITKSRVLFLATNAIVRESWAVATEYYFTLPYYPNNLSVTRLRDQSKSQIEQGGDRSWQYTPFFIDLRDNTNQLDDANAISGWADDDVSGYTLKQMQEAMNKKTKLSGIRTYLKDNYNNSTEGHLGKLVDFYQDIHDDNK